MSFEQFFTKAPYVRPALNVGCLQDIPTGPYYVGAKGESICNGGMANLSANGARAKKGKSVQLQHQFLTVLKRYSVANAVFNETEFTGSRARINHLSVKKGLISEGQDLEEMGRYVYTDKGSMSGTKLMTQLKAYGKHRRAEEKLLETPFVDRVGKPVSILPPYIVAIDSFSEFHVDAQEDIQKIAAGDSKRNMEAMTDGRHKTQVFADLSQLAVEAGFYVYLTAHIGDQYEMDQYNPTQKRLGFLKRGGKFKNVPEKFTFLPSNVWEIVGAGPLWTKEKTVMFPQNQDDCVEGDTDLMLATMVNLRGNGGPSGMPCDYIYSQRDGIHVGLTEYWYLKEHEKFGLGGNDINYFLELCPNVKLSRTTIRRKIDNDPKLQRALEITSELLQIQIYQRGHPEGFLCDAKTLYEDLKNKGYDWDVLLSTRGYWTFDQYTHPVPFLSTKDLLLMRAGAYHPYWWDELCGPLVSLVKAA